jgi:hypothetical protein
MQCDSTLTFIESRLMGIAPKRLLVKACKIQQACKNVFSVTTSVEYTLVCSLFFIEELHAV